MAVQDRRMITRLRSHIEQGKLPLDKDSKKDLQTHRVIDVLPERSAESVKCWLEAHPQIEVVSRDRGNTYIDGATQGAPLTRQVCDRWHLCKNIGDAIEDFLRTNTHPASRASFAST